jgi:hypothetical protein
LEDISLNEHTLAEAESKDDAPASRFSNLTRRIGTGVAGAAFLSAMGPIGAALVSGRAAAQTAISDIDILNFALNLEYIEAEFYLRAVTGQGLGAGDINGVGNTGGVNGGSAVPFTSGLLAQYAENIAIDEQQHVRFLRSARSSTWLAGSRVQPSQPASRRRPRRSIRSAISSASSSARSSSRTWALRPMPARRR